MKDSERRWVGIGAAFVGVMLLARRAFAGASAATPASASGAGPAKPLGREMLDVPGLRVRIAAEPLLPQKFFEMIEAMGWGPEQADYLSASIGGIESRWDPQATNKSTNATGLIQFMPATAASLGTSVDALRGMTAVDQLPFVRAYFRDRKLNPRDIYPTIFYPAIVGKSDEFVIGSAGQKVYDQNAGLDRNKDGVLTAGDVRGKADGVVAAARNKPRIPV